MPLTKDMITYKLRYSLMNYQRERLILLPDGKTEEYRLDFQIDLITPDPKRRTMHVVKAVAGAEEYLAREYLNSCKGYMKLDKDLQDWRLKFYLARLVDECVV